MCAEHYRHGMARDGYGVADNCMEYRPTTEFHQLFRLAKTR
jgi:hypothetical protein